MARHLRLQVMLNAVDRVTGPLKRMRLGIGHTGQALRDTRDQLTRQQTEFDRSTSALLEYRHRTRYTGDEVNRLTQHHATQTERIRGLTTRMDAASISTGNLGRNARTLLTNEEQISTALQEQTRHLSDVAKRQHRLNQARDRYQHGMSNVARNQGVGMGMLDTGVSQTYAASRLLAPGVAWGEQMSTVQAAGGFDADDERYQALRQQSRELGSSTPFSSADIGVGQAFMLQGSIGSEAIQASMRDVLDLALANNTELTRAAEITANIAGTYHIDIETDGAMTRIADLLTGTARRANVSLEMLSDTMTSLSNADELNLTIEQAASMAGMLENIGIQSSMAETALHSMTHRLADPAKAGRDAIEQINLDVVDANGNMRAMPDLLRDIHHATRALGNVERHALLSQIFGDEAGSGMSELVNGMSNGSLDGLLNAPPIPAGENAEVARVRTDNLGGDLKDLRSAWEEVGISITDTNDGPLRDLVQTITAITVGVGDWIKANPDLAGTIAKVAAGMIALATVGGAVTMTFANILPLLLFAKFAMATLGITMGSLGTALSWIAKTAIPWVAGALKGLLVAMGPIGWGIAAIAGAAFLIYQYWDPIKAFFVGLWQQVKAAFDEGVGGVARLLINWSPLGLLYRAMSLALDRLGIEMPTTLTELGANMIAGLSNGIQSARQGISDKWNTIKALFDWSPMQAIRDQWAPLGPTGQQAVSDALSAVTPFWDNLKALFDWSPVQVLRDQWAQLGPAGQQAVSDTLLAITPSWDNIKALFDWSPAEAISNAWSGLHDVGANVMDGLLEGIDSKWQAIRDKISGLGDSIIGIFRTDQEIQSPSRVWARLGGHTMEGLAEGIEHDADAPLTAVSRLSHNLRNAAGGLMLGAGLATHASAASIDTSGIQIDARPPLQSHASAAPSGGLVIHGGISIEVNATPGMDEQALARLVNEQVQRALQDAERRAAAASRRNFYDND